jgi:uncharacterized membrane protein YhaH (DUF805 family)
MYYYRKVLQNYTNFSGRAQRAEYWYFYLINVLISIALIYIDMFVGTYNSTTGVGLIQTSYALLVFLPALAVLVRRLHDIGKSGWWVFLLLIPLIGFIWLIILLVGDSEPGDNQYGPNPKRVPAPTTEAPPPQTSKQLY